MDVNTNNIYRDVTIDQLSEANVGETKKIAGWIETDRRWHTFRHTEKSCNCENNDCFDCGERLNKGNESGIHRKCTSYNNDNHDYNHYNNQGNNYD